jgi:hypothetical protein
MKRLRHIAAGSIAVAGLCIGMARGATTTNFTDQWWIERESGWGAAVLQQWDTLFINLFVYDADSKATWFVAAAGSQTDAPAGHTVFAGDVYATTGPFYGAPFSAAPVAGRKVGTLTFDADTATTATLRYSVDGTDVIKNVTRQTWSLQDLSGRYFGGIAGERTLCGDSNGYHEEQGAIEIVHGADNTFTLKRTDLSNRTVTYTGAYSQSGRMGQVAITGGNGPDAETVTEGSLYEIERTGAGITGRAHLVTTSGANVVCTFDGRWGGARR